MLSGQSGAALEIAKRNTRRLAAGGVAIAVGSSGDTVAEMERLADAGMSPSEVLVAATRNGAWALRRLEDTGTIEPGKRADLLVLTANPAEDVGNLRRIGARMVDGLWVER
jgi:imidazolonepropionase-like amidohydrolase